MIGRILAVSRKEIGTFLLTPMGSVLLFVFTLLAGWWFFFLQRFFVRGEASVQGLFGALSLLHLVFAPAVTMRLWAEERRNGTYEVLMTLPVRAGEWVVGKYLAACGILALWFVSMAPAIWVVHWFGDPDPGPLLGGLLGCFLLGASYLAIGCFVSALTENQIIASIGSVAVSMFFYLLHHDTLRALFPGFLGVLLHQSSLETHYQALGRGVVDTGDLVFFLGFIAFFLYANTKAVQRRKAHPLNLLLAAFLVMLVVWHARSPALRLDLTEERRYTLSEPTRKVLDRVDLSSPIELTAYLSTDLPAQWQPSLRDTRDLLREFAERAPGRVILRILDPSRSEAVREAVESQGIEASQFRAGGASSVEIQVAYFALVLECAERRSVLNPVPVRSTAELEYQLAQRISRLTRLEPLSVGFQQCDQSALGQRNRVRDRYRVQSEFQGVNLALSTHYDTTVVNLANPVDPEVAVLVVANDEKLNRLELYHLDQFLMRGGNLMLLSPGTYPSGIGRSADRAWVRGPSAGQAASLYLSWGIEVVPDVVMDAQNHDFEMLPGRRNPVPQPAIPLLFADSMADHPTRAGVAALRLPYPSSLVLQSRPEVQITELLQTSAQALHDSSSLLTLDPTGPGSVPDPVRELAQYDQRFLLGAWLEGRFRSPYLLTPLPEELWGQTGCDRETTSESELKEKLGYCSESPLDSKILAVGCADFLTNSCLEKRDDNLVFFLNAIDLLVGSEDLSSLRAKRFLARVFPEPSEQKKSLGLFVGTFVVPILWITLGVVVYAWRRVLRPARARIRRENAGARP